MTTQLHEILAVESTKEGLFKSLIPDQINLFKNKANHFAGFERTLSLKGEDSPDKTAREDAEREHQTITTTVATELKYIALSAGAFFDVIHARDEANQRAVADIVINGEVIASNVPATTLLALENKLKQLRPVYEQIPTLQPGVSWVEDPAVGDNVYKDANPEVRAKTKKSWDFKTIVQATDKFPAQVEKWEVTEDVGYFSKIRWSSLISTADKSKLLSRFDELANAVKQARQRANTVEVRTGLPSIGDQLFNFLHSK